MKRILPFLLLALATGSAHAAEPPFDAEYNLDAARFLAVADFEIVYFAKGEGEPVLFFHPQMDYRGWQAQIEALSDDYRTIAFSFRMSNAPPFDPLDPGAIIAAVEGLVETLGLGKVHFVGHSMGGLQAMLLAAERPDLLASLTMEEPAPTGLDMRDKQPQCALPPDHPGFGFCMFMSILAGPGDYEGRSKAQQDYMAAPFAAGGPATPPEAGGMGPLPDACDTVGRISVPVLFLRGGDTPDFFQEGLDHHETCLPPHKTVPIPDASHLTHFDAPQAYNEALLSFIARH